MKKIRETVYECEECGMRYADATTARACEDWCAKHHSCNITIIKNALREDTK